MEVPSYKQADVLRWLEREFLASKTVEDAETAAVLRSIRKKVEELDTTTWRETMRERLQTIAAVSAKIHSEPRFQQLCGTIANEVGGSRGIRQMCVELALSIDGAAESNNVVWGKTHEYDETLDSAVQQTYDYILKYKVVPWHYLSIASMAFVAGKCVEAPCATDKSNG